MAKETARRRYELTRLALTEARARFGEIIRRVQKDKEHFVLERDGVPVAALIDIDQLEDYLELQDPKVRAIIEESHADYLAGRTRPADALAAELQNDDDGERARKPQTKARRKAG